GIFQLTRVASPQQWHGCMLRQIHPFGRLALIGLVERDLLVAASHVRAHHVAWLETQLRRLRHPAEAPNSANLALRPKIPNAGSQLAEQVVAAIVRPVAAAPRIRCSQPLCRRMVEGTPPPNRVVARKAQL